MVEYALDPVSEKLADIEIVPASRPAHTGSSPTFRRGYFDLSIAREIAPYDKTGGRLLVKAIKFYFFGGKNLTRSRCEQFFDDVENFD